MIWQAYTIKPTEKISVLENVKKEKESLTNSFFEYDREIMHYKNIGDNNRLTKAVNKKKNTAGSQ
jgi:hypothetical protein